MARMLETNHTSEDQSPNFSLFTTLPGHKGAVSCVKFSPCGQYLASCSYDKVIKLWSSNDGQIEENLLGHKKGISDVSWSHDSCQLVSASDDKTLKLWNIATATCVKTLKGHQNVVFCTAFSAKSNLIVSGSDDESAKVWDARTCKCVRTLKHHADRVTAAPIDMPPQKPERNVNPMEFLIIQFTSKVGFDVLSHFIMTSSLDGFCHVYDIRNGQVLYTFGEGAAISYAKFSRNGKYIMASTQDDTIKLWDFTKFMCVKVYKGHTNKTYSIFADFTTGGKYVVSGSEDRNIYVWHLNSKKLVQTLEGHSDVVVCVDCHPDHNLIASGGLEEDKSIKLWKSADLPNSEN